MRAKRNRNHGITTPPPAVREIAVKCVTPWRDADAADLDGYKPAFAVPPHNCRRIRYTTIIRGERVTIERRY